MNRYEGEYIGNEKSGQGTFWYPDGSVYEGPWAEGQRNGYGIYTYPNGDRYQGEWKEDRRHGQGDYIYKDQGLRYKGRYRQEARKPVRRRILGVRILVKKLEVSKMLALDRYRKRVIQIISTQHDDVRHAKIP